MLFCASDKILNLWEMHGSGDNNRAGAKGTVEVVDRLQMTQGHK